MNLTAKKQFLEKKPYADAHRELVVSTQFREALHAALIEQIMALPVTHDPDQAAAAYSRIIGARDFIQQLLNIGEPQKSPSPPITANLDHKVR